MIDELQDLLDELKIELDKLLWVWQHQESKASNYYM